jgi:mannose-6-phosphate isomerase-like protein (cupin superfamily)
VAENADNCPVENPGYRVLRAFGQEAHVLVSSEQTGAAFCILRFFASPGADAPPHTHQNEDETFLIESGELEINLGGQVVRGRKGDAVYLPKRVPHAPKIVGSENLEAIVICVPGGFDQFFAACAEEWAKPQPDMKSIAEIGARFGIQFQVP